MAEYRRVPAVDDLLNQHREWDARNSPTPSEESRQFFAPHSRARPGVRPGALESWTPGRGSARRDSSAGGGNPSPRGYAAPPPPPAASPSLALGSPMGQRQETVAVHRQSSPSKRYYYNSVTRESSWKMPADSLLAQPTRKWIQDDPRFAQSESKLAEMADKKHKEDLAAWDTDPSIKKDLINQIAEEERARLEKAKFKYGEIYFEETGRTVPYILVPDNERGRKPEQIIKMLNRVTPGGLNKPEITFKVRSSRESYFEFAQEIYANPVLAEAWGWRSHPMIMLGLDRQLTSSQKQSLVSKLPKFLEYPHEALHLSAVFTTVCPEVDPCPDAPFRQGWKKEGCTEANQSHSKFGRSCRNPQRTVSDDHRVSETYGGSDDANVEYLVVKLLKVPRELWSQSDGRQTSQKLSGLETGLRDHLVTKARTMADSLASGVKDYFAREQKAQDTVDSRRFANPVKNQLIRFAVKIPENIQHDENLTDSYVEMYSYDGKDKDFAIRDFGNRDP